MFKVNNKLLTMFVQHTPELTAKNMSLKHNVFDVSDAFSTLSNINDRASLRKDLAAKSF